jgi:hypothetical protein
MESRVQVLAAAKRIWLVRENFSPMATVEGRTSQACRFQPNFNRATSIMTTKAVVGIYQSVRRSFSRSVDCCGTIARRMNISSRPKLLEIHIRV